MSCKHIQMADSRPKHASLPSMSLQAEELRRKLLREGSLVLDIKVIPRARTGQISELMANGALKIKVTAPPEKGKANDEVCAVLAGYLGVPKRSVEVILGHTSPQKRVRVHL
jgi:uncharacterized protein (TIGR00251 family)